MTIFDDFRTHGINASVHYADDTASGEWRLGSIEEAKALKIFDANPDDQDEMREIAKGFLWSLNSKRPKLRRPISEYDEYDIERPLTDGKVKNTRTGEVYDSTTTSIDDYPPDLESGL